MKKSRIALAVLAAFSVAVLFVTYGTVLPAAPFAAVQLDGPTAVDSDGEMTAIADSGSRRALLVLLPSTVAAGYPSLMFPLFSADLGLSKSDINNIVVLGQLIVFICINLIERMEGRYGKPKLAVFSVALLGAVFLLFSFNTTLAWSVAVIALVGLLCKTSDAWKSLWLSAASEAGVSAGKATGAMFSARSLARVAQPFILGGLLDVSSGSAFIVIGVFCAACAGLFFLLTRK